MQKKKHFYFLTGILSLTAICYVFAINNDFLHTWDDNRYVINNPLIKSTSIENIQNIFTTYYDGHYHPLTIMSLTMDYHFFKLDAGGFHIHNIILHLISTGLVYWFVLLLFKNSTVAFVTAALFGISPMHVESVVWISERKNLLYGLFFFLSLISYLKYIDKKHQSFYLLSVLIFIMALLSKAMAIPMVLVLVLIDYLKKRDLLSRQVILEKIPFLLLAFATGLVAIIAQEDTWGEGLGQEYHSFINRIAFASYALTNYAVKSFIPFSLSGFYPYPDYSHFAPVSYWFFLIPGLLLGGYWVYSFRKSRRITFALGFFIVNIFLLLKLFEVPAGDYIMADRYNYIPSVGLFMLAGLAFNEGLNNYKKFRILLPAGLGIYLLILGFVTIFRISAWENDLSFFSDIIRKHPKESFAYLNRGAVKKKYGDHQGALKDFNKAVKYTEGSYKPFANRAAVHFELGHYKSAISDYTRAIDLGGNKSMIFAGRGNAYLHSGKYLSAVRDYDQALSLNPDYAEAYANRGIARYSMGNQQQAIDDYNKAIQLDSNYYLAYFNRGLSRINTGELQNAIDDFNKVIEIRPNYPDAYANRAIAKSRLNFYDDAFRDYEKALSLKPNYFEVFLNRGIDNLNINKPEAAISDLNNAIQLNPNYPVSYYFRGLAFKDIGRIQQACADFQKAASAGMQNAAEKVNENCK